MSTSEPIGLGQLEAALRELNIPGVSAPDLGALPFARGGAGLDYAGIAAALAAPALRTPVASPMPSVAPSFYFLEANGAPEAAGRAGPPARDGIRRPAEFPTSD